MMSEIKTIGVVGAGTMGQGIAMSCALAGYNTLLFDIDAGLREIALQRIHQSVDLLISKGKLTNEAGTEGLSRIRSIDSLSDLRVDIIIEAIITVIIKTGRVLNPGDMTLNIESVPDMKSKVLF